MTKFGMKLNPAKYLFNVPSDKFLGYQVHQRGIEVTLTRSKRNMVSLKNLKDVQKFTGCLASLNMFIAKSIDRCLPFFKAPKKGKRIE